MHKVLSTYVQKSRIFLYPLIGAKNIDIHLQPKTYISWSSKIHPLDKKLIVIFDQTDKAPELLINHEKRYLFSSGFFDESSYRQITNDKSLYIFNLENFKNDYNLFLEGRYSEMSDVAKEKIMKYYSISLDNVEYVESWLYPGRYYSIYADLLNVSQSTLSKELCSPPDMTKENLKDYV
jgi:hypothetical protein